MARKEIAAEGAKNAPERMKGRKGREKINRGCRWTLQKSIIQDLKESGEKSAFGVFEGRKLYQ